MQYQLPAASCRLHFSNHRNIYKQLHKSKIYRTDGPPNDTYKSQADLGKNLKIRWRHCQRVLRSCFALCSISHNEKIREPANSASAKSCASYCYKAHLADAHYISYSAAFLNLCTRHICVHFHVLFGQGGPLFYMVLFASNCMLIFQCVSCTLFPH